MLHAPVNETKAENGQTRRPLTPLPERERYPLSVEAPERPSLTGSASRSTQRPAVARSRSAVGSLQRLYGNQAVLQMRYGSGGLPAPSVPLRPSQSGILQRKCACGGAAGMSGKCEECSEKMGCGLQTKLTISEPGDAYEQEADRIADQVMSTSAHPAASSAPPRIQRLAGQPTAQVDAAPASVDQTLASTGKPLEPALRQDMEQRFGYDFSRVRVHIDSLSAESARAANALAYTVGLDIVFGAGKYAPGTTEGKSLLAHELTHVVQQGMADGSVERSQDRDSEMEAQKSSRDIGEGKISQINTRTPFGTFQHKEEGNALDEKAKAIIAKANDTKVKTEGRGIQVVKDIIQAYYPSYESKVDVEFDDKKAGTGLHAYEYKKGQKDKTKGLIYVGTEFVKGVDERHFARRVLQVKHELEHLDQYKEGKIVGGKKSNEREFIAFYHEALGEEKKGTGQIQHATRVTLIDAALGYYYCLDADEKKSYSSNKEELVKRRVAELKSSGRTEKDMPLPTECKKQS